MSDALDAISNPAVRAVYQSWPPAVQARVLALRRMLLEVAEDLECGPIEEALRWGEPAYLTRASGSGTTVRLASKDPDGGGYALYVHCQTDLVSTWRERHGDQLTYEGTRAVHFRVDEPVDDDIVRDCLASALTYKRRRRR